MTTKEEWIKEFESRITIQRAALQTNPDRYTFGWVDPRKVAKEMEEEGIIMRELKDDN